MKKPRRKGTPAPATTRQCEQCGAPYILVQSLDALFKTPGRGYGSYKATCKCEPPTMTKPTDEVPF